MATAREGMATGGGAMAIAGANSMGALQRPLAHRLPQADTGVRGRSPRWQGG